MYAIVSIDSMPVLRMCDVVGEQLLIVVVVGASAPDGLPILLLHSAVPPTVNIFRRSELVVV